MWMKSEFNLLSTLVATLTKSINEETNVSIIELKTLSLKRAQTQLDRLLTTADL